MSPVGSCSVCTGVLPGLPPTLARRATLLSGTRWEDEDGINRYHCADEGRGFSVEVGVDYGQEQPVVLRRFVSSVLLADYSYWAQLPEL